MSGLAALLAGHTPAGVYQWHNAAHVDDVRHAVEHAGWRFAWLDGWTVEDREAFIKAAAAALDLPNEPAGDLQALTEGWDALDCGEHGTVLLWDGWSPLARHDGSGFTSVLEALRRRTADPSVGTLAVVLRGDGPTLAVEELPIKH